MTVAIAIIHGSYGCDCCVDRTYKGLLKQLRNYVDERWAEVSLEQLPEWGGVSPEQLPDDDEKAVNMYFDEADGEEWVDMFLNKEVGDADN